MPTILVVDDSQTMRNNVKELLLKEGFDVLQAESGEQGLEMMGLHKVNLVVSDLNMPGMDGLTMCNHIKQQGYDVPIFMLTTQANPELKIRAKEYGVLAWIVKPYKADTLTQGIRKVLGMP